MRECLVIGRWCAFFPAFHQRLLVAKVPDIWMGVQHASKEYHHRAGGGSDQRNAIPERAADDRHHWWGFPHLHRSAPISGRERKVGG